LGWSFPPGREAVTGPLHKPFAQNQGWRLHPSSEARLSRGLPCKRNEIAAQAQYQIAPYLTRPASPVRIAPHGEGQRLRSVRRGGNRRADSRRRNHDDRCLSPLRRVGCTAVRPRHVRSKAEPRKNESQAVVPARRDATIQSFPVSGPKSARDRRPRPCHRPERGLARPRGGA
jgi:hypothetical protein